MALAMAIILGIGVVITGILSIHKYERTLADLLNSRFQFVIHDIRQNIETRMDLGLSLKDLEGVSDELDTYVRADSEILSIEVFDDSGTVMFSNDISLVGDLVSENLIFAWRENRGKMTWSGLESDAGVVGAPIRNNLDQEEGSLVLRFSREFLDQSVLAQTERLVVTSGTIILIMIVLSIIGAMLLLRRPTHDLQYIGESAIDIAINRQDANKALWTEVGNPNFPKFSDSILEAHNAIDAATDEIRQLDEDASD